MVKVGWCHSGRAPIEVAKRGTQGTAPRRECPKDGLPQGGMVSRRDCPKEGGPEERGPKEGGPLNTRWKTLKGPLKGPLRADG